MTDDDKTTTRGDERDDEVVSSRASAQDRLAKVQRQQRRSSHKGTVIGVVVALAVVAALGGGAFWLIKRERDAQQAAAGNVTVGEVKTYDNLSREHITSGYDYPQTPPVGGNHNAVWANCGVYDREVPPQYAVHSLEHGAVWVTYKDSLPEGQVSLLKGKAGQQQGYMLVSQQNDQATPVVLTAWGKQLHLNSASDPKIDTFIRDFLQGPQTPEPGAACSGGYDPNTGQIAGGM